MADQIVAGNVYDKWGTRNPVARRLFAGFQKSLLELIKKTGAESVHEVGCGEGRLAAWLAETLGREIKASDQSEEIIALAKEINQGSVVDFYARSIYDLRRENDSAELIICSEVLEHLEEPGRALAVIREIARPYAIFSVPREPVWRLLNLLRARYLGQWGNTPGHVQHWSTSGFLDLLAEYFQVLEVRTPFPWTMALCRTKPGSSSTSTGRP